ncbi:MAG TPA: Crp/Fnr family transcriptional regulator [Steroidobacteraceae bacterium]|nr:Crp/Fnr family transcriptional regulator [Steroidobacteraceae bacterium]
MASLRAEDFSLLQRHLREVRLNHGDVLEERDQRSDGVFFPQSGMISLIVEMPEDETIEVGMVGSEGAVGVNTGLGSRFASVTALVQVDGTAFKISASRFRAVAADSQSLRDMIIRYNEMQLGQIQQTAACNALHDVGSRLSRWLLQTSDRTNSDVIPFTREFLGKMLGVRRGTVSMVAAAFEQAGLIETHRGEIKLLDRDGLRKEACYCYDYLRKHVDRLLP